ncbi:MAG: hypothetical protein JOZ19_06380 [Rubrobacter sp.]|nr:hypothetical protein [Rubrobacter sp.]
MRIHANDAVEDNEVLALQACTLPNFSTCARSSLEGWLAAMPTIYQHVTSGGV